MLVESLSRGDKEDWKNGQRTFAMGMTPLPVLYRMCVEKEMGLKEEEGKACSRSRKQLRWKLGKCSWHFILS